MARTPRTRALAATITAALLLTPVAASAVTGGGTSVIYGEVPATLSVDIAPDGSVRQVEGNVHYRVTTSSIDGVSTTTVIPAPDVVAVH